MPRPWSETIRAKLIAALCLAALMLSWAPHAHYAAQQGAHPGPIAYAHAPHPSDTSETLAACDTSDTSDAPHGSPRSGQLSSDDAHEEHSSVPSTIAEVCLACRSNASDRLARSVPPIAVLPESITPRIPDVAAHPPARSLFAGLAPLRGPPIRLL